MRAVLLHAVAAAALQPNEVWHSIKQQASVAASSESLSALMRPYLNVAIGSHDSLAPATAALLTERLGGALDSEKLTLVLEDRLDETLLARDLNAVVEGDPAEQILAEAKSIDADLIVLGAVGRSGLAKLLMGDTASSILTDSTTSLFLRS